MRRVLEVIESKIIPGLSAHSHAKLGTPTLNVGTITGGSKINIVPDKCRIEIDCRVVPGIDGEASAPRWKRNCARPCRMSP